MSRSRLVFAQYSSIILITDFPSLDCGFLHNISQFSAVVMPRPSHAWVSGNSLSYLMFNFSPLFSNASFPPSSFNNSSLLVISSIVVSITSVCPDSFLRIKIFSASPLITKLALCVAKIIWRSDFFSLSNGTK